MTEQQKKILRFIKSYNAENGYQPSVREMADHMGFKSTNAVHEHLVKMEKEGVLELTNQPRAIRIY